MAKGRGIAATSFLIFVLLVHNSYAADVGTSYTVGDSVGWVYGVSAWTNGKNFKAGDVLTFNYVRIFHNVVRVDAGNYRNCTAPPSAKVYNTGRDQIKLSKGENYFICSLPLHCQMGMRIAAYAF